MDATRVMDQVFAGGTALAGLMLVFTGVVLASYESYSSTAKATVRTKYRVRGWLSFAGFLASLTSAGFAMSTNWLLAPIFSQAALWGLGLAFLLLIAAGLLAVCDIK